ncbi:MAG: SMP-30/gluconolactonase/LRE family protein [Minicystis sp.]
MHAITKLGSFAAIASLGLAPILAACSSDASTSGTGGAAATGSSSATSSSSTGGSGGAAPAAPTFVAHFDPTKSELAEGLLIDGGKAYIGYAPLGKIVRVDLTGGAVEDFGNIPPVPANGGFLLGIVADASGAVYVGFGGGPGTEVKNGVYKLPAAGGSVSAPWAADAAMNFPNGLLFDEAGNLFVADSGGAIFKIAKDGTVSTWIADPSLAGAASTCAFMAPFTIGANGIVKRGGAFYVSNTNLAQIVEIPINADGSAGTPSIFAGPDCDALGGLDGIALDADGSIVGVVNTQSKLVRVGTDGKVTTSFTGSPLDNPASVAIHAASGVRTAYITNAAFFDEKSPAPGLLGYPLP